MGRTLNTEVFGLPTGGNTDSPTHQLAKGEVLWKFGRHLTVLCPEPTVRALSALTGGTLPTDSW